MNDPIEIGITALTFVVAALYLYVAETGKIKMYSARVISSPYALIMGLLFGAYGTRILPAGKPMRIIQIAVMLVMLLYQCIKSELRRMDMEKANHTAENTN